MDYDKQALLEAVQHLVDADNATELVTTMEAVAHLTRQYPVKLSGNFAVLNPLVKLRNADPGTYERVKAPIERKRHEAGATPAWPQEPPPKFDKTSYQRELMAQRRLRAGRALEIENMRRSERDRLMGNTRLEFERHQLATWGKQLDAQLAIARERHGGALPKAQQDAIRSRFWASVDADLDDRETAARREQMLPAHLRSRT